jgi:hypothetical protein
MRTVLLPRLAALALALTVQVGVVAEESSRDETKIARLIRQLGDDDFEVRESASQKLEKLGQPALAALRKALSSEDLEIRRRAVRLIERITDRLTRTDVEKVPPPKGAVVLFSGKQKDLEGWVDRDGSSKPAWTVEDGVLVAAGSDVRTRKTFAGRYKLHVEFRIPDQPKDTSVGRGNSGVYLHGNYEIQILDSYKVQANAPKVIHSKPTESCGAIFGQAAPRVNACKAPGFWQSFDVEFTPPRFKDGEKVADAVVTVLHNGELIHDRVKIREVTGSQGLGGDLSEAAPLMLQYHQCPVQFRNVWLLPLEK